MFKKIIQALLIPMMIFCSAMEAEGVINEKFNLLTFYKGFGGDKIPSLQQEYPHSHLTLDDKNTILDGKRFVIPGPPLLTVEDGRVYVYEAVISQALEHTDSKRFIIRVPLCSFGIESNDEISTLIDTFIRRGVDESKIYPLLEKMGSLHIFLSVFFHSEFFYELLNEPYYGVLNTVMILRSIKKIFNYYGHVYVTDSMRRMLIITRDFDPNDLCLKNFVNLLVNGYIPTMMRIIEQGQEFSEYQWIHFQAACFTKRFISDNLNNYQAPITEHTIIADQMLAKRGMSEEQLTSDPL